jgi:hypothetical protein
MNIKYCAIRHVPQFIDVSEEHGSILGAEEKAKHVSSKKQATNRATTLQMEAKCSSETSVSYWKTRRHIPENSSQYNHTFKSFKFDHLNTLRRINWMTLLCVIFRVR